jgi:hypothetical protein
MMAHLLTGDEKFREESSDDRAATGAREAAMRT